MAIFFLFLIFLATKQFNVNNSNYNFLSGLYANMSVGKPYSSFPENTLVMFALYGHKDVSFSLFDLFNHFGAFSTDIKRGSIIIGKDLKNSAVGIDSNVIAYSVPNHAVSIFTTPNDINHYFPLGYFIKENHPSIYAYDSFITSMMLNEKNYCKNICNGTVLLDSSDPNFFDVDKIFEIDIEYFQGNSLRGYVSSYDPTTQSGNAIMMIYYLPKFSQEVPLFFEGDIAYFPFKYNTSTQMFDFNFSHSIKLSPSSFDFDFNLEGYFDLKY